MHKAVSGFVDGAWTAEPTVLDNMWFRDLLDLSWEKFGVSPHIEYKASKGDSTLLRLKTDMVVLFDPDYKAIAGEYATDEHAFKSEFVSAWSKAMNSDMF